MIRVHMHVVAAIVALALTACSSTFTNQPPLTQNRELDTFSTLATFRDAEDIVVLTAATQFMAAHREHDGMAFFSAQAKAHPERAIFRSLEGVMQARVADDIALLRRVAWVDEAIAKLDDGATREPVVGRYLRGLVFAVLPARFDKSDVAIADLEAALQNSGRLPFAAERGILSALAAAFATKGDLPRAAAFRARSGGASPDLLADASVSQAKGFRFEQPHLVRAANNVYLAEGFDFSTIVFLIDPEGVVVIDAGTTETNAAAAVKALREITAAPIKHVIFTHAHWDHVGGAPAVVPGATVWASARFPADLVRIRKAQNPFRSSFWGQEKIDLDVKVDRLVTGETALELGSLSLTLVPGPSGETDDALFVFDRTSGLLFVGDAFMPYVGAPFVAEGSADGYIAAAHMVQQFPAKRLIHGHPPLTRYWTKEAMPGLEAALVELQNHVLDGLTAARPIADALHDEWTPSMLRATPAAAMPFGIVRDTFIQRLYRERAGYWAADGSGLDEFTAAEWSTVLDALAGRDDGAFVSVATDLLARGDAPMALRVLDSGLRAHPTSVGLANARQRALAMLQARFQQVNPFRFIIYSGWSGHDVRPVSK